jgi:hypothetical protein
VISKFVREREVVREREQQPASMEENVDDNMSTSLNCVCQQHYNFLFNFSELKPTASSSTAASSSMRGRTRGGPSRTCNALEEVGAQPTAPQADEVTDAGVMEEGTPEESVGAAAHLQWRQ